MPPSAHSQRNLPPSAIHILPTEIIQKIASHLDDTTLILFAFTSRTIRFKTLHTYSERFFKVLKFCLYPHSLQALTDISTSHFAKHVQYVAFGTEDIGLIDPVHDEDFRQGNSIHGPILMSAYDNNALFQLRIRYESALIYQALSKFLKLKMVLIGQNLSLHGRPVKASWGVKQLRPFTCPSGHCKLVTGSKDIRNVFHTVGAALEQMRPLRPDIEIGVEIGLSNHEALRTTPKDKQAWYPGGNAHHRVTHLQLELFSSTGDFHSLHVRELAQVSGIKSLEVKYLLDTSYVRGRLLAPTLRVSSLQLQQLERIVFKDLSEHTSGLVGFFRAHCDRLTHVSLIHCSLFPMHIPHLSRSPLSPLAASPSRDENWSSVGGELQKLPHLVFLHLERLDSAMSNERYRDERNSCLHLSMALCAIWEGKDEIKTGLQFLTTTHYTIAQLAPPYLTKHYLNLRYANFKASPAYAWTPAEASALVAFRHRTVCPATRRYEANSPLAIDDHTQFPVPGFYDGKKMPFGHQVMRPLLWGKWKTVYVSSASKAWDWASWD